MVNKNELEYTLDWTLEWLVKNRKRVASLIAEIVVDVENMSRAWLESD